MINQSLSVVIPAYNEEKCIYETLKIADEFLKKHFKDYEIILVADGCKDKTTDEAMRATQDGINLKLFINGKNKGKGASVQRGALGAIKDYVLFTDADLSTPMEEILNVVPLLERGFDIVVGSRALKDSNVVKPQGFMRQTMGRTFNLFVQALLFRGIKDTQCGFKCFRRHLIEDLFKAQRLEGFCFDAELLFIAQKWGYRMTELPVKWINREASKVAMVKDSLNMFKDLFVIRMNDWKGCYKRQET